MGNTHGSVASLEHVDYEDEFKDTKGECCVEGDEEDLAVEEDAADFDDSHPGPSGSRECEWE